jgi:aminoglycoside phosphotransferase (APT) family kinase protein
MGDQGAATAGGGGSGEVARTVDPERITTSTRDPEVMAAQLGAWLAGTLPAGSDPEVVELTSPQGNGMSSETLLMTARWTDGADRAEHRLVARVAPPETAYPVFPTYDLAMQHRVMGLVAERTAVPVPATHWFEADPDVLGGPFFVMDRVEGRVPPDVLPYTFGDNWVFDATDDERQRLEASTIGVMAGIHALTADRCDLDFLQVDQPGETALERHLAHWEAYHEWVVGEQRSALLDACFAWLRANLPDDVGADALSWGDGRIGNMLFDGFEAAAVLDWEMAGVAPPEVDLGWMIYLHLFFQDLATQLGAPGLPGMFRPVDVRRAYAEVTGRAPGDLRWHIAYAAMRHGVIMRRVTERSVFFGEAERPDDLDDLIIHRTTLAAMLDGSYWEGVAL